MTSKHKHELKPYKLLMNARISTQLQNEHNEKAYCSLLDLMKYNAFKVQLTCT